VKVGDLVKAKHKYSKNEIGFGIVLEVEEGFYGKSYNDYLDDRLTIYWAHGETTQEPCTYVEKLAENKE
jgi:hypothetical protein